MFATKLYSKYTSGFHMRREQMFDKKTFTDSHCKGEVDSSLTISMGHLT